MTVAEAEEDLTRDRGTPSEAQLLDVLYEVLAQGVDPKGSLSVAEVERFLHEHARNQKSLEEMLAFFARHGLPTNAADYAADPELGELASGLHRERGPVSALFPLDGDAGEPSSEPIAESRTNPQVSASVAPEVAAPLISMVVPRQVERRTPWLRIAVGALGVGLCAAFAFSYVHARELEGKLQHARLQQRTTDLALTQLEQRSEGLRSALSQSESERAALSTRFDSFVAQETERRAAEEQALKQLLGPRYDTLRAKALAAGTTSQTP